MQSLSRLFYILKTAKLGKRQLVSSIFIKLDYNTYMFFIKVKGLYQLFKMKEQFRHAYFEKEVAWFISSMDEFLIFRKIQISTVSSFYCF